MTDFVTLRRRSLGSFKWSLVGEILSRSLQPLLVLVVGALIPPAQFGLLAVATIVLGVGQILQDFGLGKALIQREGEIASLASHAFWANILLSVGLCALVWTTAPSIAAFFKAPESVWLIRLLSLRLIATALSTVQLALLQRQMEFKALFRARLAGAIAAVVITLPLANAGHGVWALGWGMVGNGIVQAAVLWAQGDWRPTFDWSWSSFAALFVFSKWILLEALLAAAIQWGDSAIVGHYLGPDGLGKYRMAANAIAFLTGMLFAPLTPVAFSWLSRLQSERGEFVATLTSLTRGATLLSMPLGFGLAAISGSLVQTALGSSWQGTEWVLTALGVKLALDWTVGFNAVAYTASGRPDINVKLLTIVCAVSLPAFAIAAPYGLLVFSVARLVAAAVDNILNAGMAFRLFGHGGRNLRAIVWPALPAAVGMAGFVWLIGRSISMSGGVFPLLGLVVGGVLFFVAIACALDRRLPATAIAFVQQISRSTC